MIGSILSKIRGTDTEDRPTDDPAAAADRTTTDGASNDIPGTESQADSAEPTVEPRQRTTPLSTPAANHQSVLGPADIERRSTAIRTDRKSVV